MCAAVWFRGQYHGDSYSPQIVGKASYTTDFKGTQPVKKYANQIQLASLRQKFVYS